MAGCGLELGIRGLGAGRALPSHVLSGAGGSLQQAERLGRRKQVI